MTTQNIFRNVAYRFACHIECSPVRHYNVWKEICNKFIGCLTIKLAFHYSIKGQKLVKVMTNLFFRLLFNKEFVHISICHLDTEMVF